MTTIDINNCWIKSEENPPFYKDSFGYGSFVDGRLSSLSEAHYSLVFVLETLVLDSNTILMPCPSKCMPIPRVLQKSIFVSCFSILTFTGEILTSSIFVISTCIVKKSKGVCLFPM